MSKQPDIRIPRFHPKKSLGQHFLHNPQIVLQMISGARFQKSDVVMEIGPGKGALTIPLSRAVGQVIAVEKDAELIVWLKERLLKEGISNVTVVHEDILKYDFEQLELPGIGKLKIMGNLPYNISSPFLEKLIKNRHRVNKAVLMFQLEIGRRLAALPGNKSYGAMTVMIQYHAKVSRMFAVSKKAFFPVPKVDSMVLELDFDRPHPNRAADEANFRRLVKGAFSHRRKTLFNSLRSLYPSLNHEKILLGIENCGVDSRARAETLGMDQFICLAEAIDIDTSATSMINRNPSDFT